MNQLYILDMLSVIYSYHVIIPILFSLFMSAKIFLLYGIGMRWQKTANQAPLFLLSIILLSYLIAEIGVIFFFCKNGDIARAIWRISWNAQPIQFYAQMLLIRSLVQRKYTLQQRDKQILSALFVFIFFPTLLLFIESSDSNILFRSFFDIFCKAGIIKRFLIKTCGPIFLISVLQITWRQVTDSTVLPNVLRLQLRLFFILMCMPLFPDFLSVFISAFCPEHQFTFNLLRLIDLFSVASFTIAALFFARRIYHLRFLNLTERIIAGPTSRLTPEHLMEIKYALCKVKNIDELSEIHTKFFVPLANIAPDRIIFYVRKPEQRNADNNIAQVIEQFIQENQELASQCFVEDSLLVYDELAFTHFYEQSDEIATLLSFLEQIDAVVFIPLKHIDRFFGAIIITKEKSTKKDELFCQTIQTQMQLYGTFVAYALAQLENVSYHTFLEERKTLSTELYKMIQKNARFHETIMSFLKPNTMYHHGVLFYKTSHFSCMNTEAEKLLQINPNLHQGHPLTKALKEVTRRAVAYGASQTLIEKNISGNDICCQAFLHKNDEVFILVFPADIRHAISIEQALLNPSDIDYAIFLQATEAGAIINRAFPGGGDILHGARLQFLKIVLSKKAMVLDVHEDDVAMCLEIAKKTCQRTVVQDVDPKKLSPDAVISLLFGTQLFQNHDIVTKQGLLYALDQSGIIHIANAHCLDQKTQGLLLRFFKTGTFFVHKTEQRQTSNAIIIMSSQEDLHALTKQGLFSQELSDYLHDAIITLPDLFRLPFAELDALARSLQKQMIIAPEYYHVFGFSSSELEELDCNRPASYAALQRRITVWIKQNMARSVVVQETTLYSPRKEGDDMLLEAARRGKQTLKDRKMMRALWEKFKNQSKIAQLLDVDKSSVHRRLKEYGIVKVSQDE